jgi:hypothetical protein
MAFMRHVGKHGDRKVAVVFREVPGEPHMALVVYTEILNRTIHDPLIQCIESDIGQNSEDLALALNRSYTTDGQIILQKLHAEGMLKKVQTELIVMTPQPNTRIKLNELNKILDQMKMGEDAVKKLAEMDNQLGMQDPMAVARRMRGDKDAFTPETIPGNKQTPAGIDVVGDLLGDEALASNLRTQAERMSNEAKGLLAEAQRLIDQASGLDPAARSISKASIDTTASTAKKTRGRPKKTLAV